MIVVVEQRPSEKKGRNNENDKKKPAYPAADTSRRKSVDTFLCNIAQQPINYSYNRNTSITSSKKHCHHPASRQTNKLPKTSTTASLRVTGRSADSNRHVGTTTTRKVGLLHSHRVRLRMVIGGEDEWRVMANFPLDW